MKFLNFNKVLCLGAHPDDVEYGMLGTIMKYKDTQFDILVLLRQCERAATITKEVIFGTHAILLVGPTSIP